MRLVRNILLEIPSHKTKSFDKGEEMIDYCWEKTSSEVSKYDSSISRKTNTVKEDNIK